MLPTKSQAKEALRQEIMRQIQAFLDQGRAITYLDVRASAERPTNKKGKTNA